MLRGRGGCRQRGLPLTQWAPACRLGHHPGPLLAEMTERLCAAVEELEAKQLSLVAWSLAKLESREEQYVATSKLLDAIASASIALATDFHAQVRSAAASSAV